MFMNQPRLTGFRRMWRTSGIMISSHQDRRDQLHHHEPRDLDARGCSAAVSPAERRRLGQGSSSVGMVDHVARAGCDRARPCLLTIPKVELRRGRPSSGGRDGPCRGPARTLPGDLDLPPAGGVASDPRPLSLSRAGACASSRRRTRGPRPTGQPAGSSPTTGRDRSPRNGGRANSSPMVVTRECPVHADRQWRRRGSSARSTRDSPVPTVADRIGRIAELGGPGRSQGPARQDIACGQTARTAPQHGAPFIPGRIAVSTPQQPGSRNFSQSRVAARNAQSRPCFEPRSAQVLRDTATAAVMRSDACGCESDDSRA